jgi:hypothetical protein
VQEPSTERVANCSDTFYLVDDCVAGIDLVDRLDETIHLLLVGEEFTERDFSLMFRAFLKCRPEVLQPALQQAWRSTPKIECFQSFVDSGSKNYQAPRCSSC